MAKMTVLYKTPKDIEAFEKHYHTIHIPLAIQLPGLKKYEISKGNIISPTGNSETYLIGNLYFDSLDDIKQAFNSEIGRQCAADRKILAPGDEDVQMYLYETTDAG